MEFGYDYSASIEIGLGGAIFMSDDALEWYKTLLKNSEKLFKRLDAENLLKDFSKYNDDEKKRFYKVIERYAPVGDSCELSECVGYWSIRDKIWYATSFPDAKYEAYDGEDITMSDGTVWKGSGKKLVDLGQPKKTRRHHYVIYITNLCVGG